MFKRLYISLALALTANFASGQITLPNMPIEVGIVMQGQQDAWNNGDIPRFMEGYWNSDSLMFVGSRGLSYGYETTLNNYLKSYPNREAMGHLTFTNKNWTQISENSGLLVGSWYLSDEANGMYSLVWRKVNGEWVIVADHSS